MKVVINNCFGGFGLSHKATMRYGELSGTPLYAYVNLEHDWEEPARYVPVDETNSHMSISYFTQPLTQENVSKADEVYFSRFDMKRTDPALIQVVEEMGEAANGPHSNLLVVDIPAGTRFIIHEYDGNESIQCDQDFQWITAT